MRSSTRVVGSIARFKRLIILSVLKATPAEPLQPSAPNLIQSQSRASGKQICGLKRASFPVHPTALAHSYQLRAR
jgi:hypothetical protein